MRRYELSSGCGTIAERVVDDPTCTSAGIVLKVEAVSLCSTDISYYRGHLASSNWPIVPGHELVGSVVEVGNECDPRFRVGDRVTYWGQTDFDGLAEYRAITPIGNQVPPDALGTFVQRGFRDASRAAVAHVPEEVTARAATLAEPLTSVLRSLLTFPPAPESVVLVLGCGPSGLLAVRTLRALLGVERIVCVDRDPQKRARAIAWGADDALETLDPDRTDCMGDPTLGWVDYVFDGLPHVSPSGFGSDIRSRAMRSLRPGGLYTIYGATSVPQQIDTWRVMQKSLQDLRTSRVS